MNDWAVQLLTEEEGVKSHAYLCNGLTHIGMGCLVDSSVPCDGLCQEAITAQSAHDVAKARALASALPGYANANDVRQAVLVSMCFQLGSLYTWPLFRAALAAGDYDEAATQMLASHWALQTPARARREAEMFRSGSWIQKS